MSCENNWLFTLCLIFSIPSYKFSREHLEVCYFSHSNSLILILVGFLVWLLSVFLHLNDTGSVWAKGRESFNLIIVNRKKTGIEKCIKMFVGFFL